MRTVNRVVLVGRLGRDPEMRTTGENAWGTFSLATNRSRRDGESWVEDTDWHQVKVHGKDAEFVAQYVRKGALVTVEGAVIYERWVNKAGEKMFGTKILANRISLIASAAPNLAKESVVEAMAEAAAI